MLEGCYYRCPIAVEEHDKDYPRFFVLAQLQEYNELSDTVVVKIHDLLGSGLYYSEVIAHRVFRATEVTRCTAMIGGLAQSPWGKAKILSLIPAEDELNPNWYYIQLENGICRKVRETDLQIEYSQMNHSPLAQLKSYEFQHPSWFLNRLKVSRNVHLIDHAAYGFDVLAGCRAYLLPHQLSTVARCFETRPIRYMLADEVGLGKTVEACSILKIMSSEDHHLRTLILVPSALLSQWKSELKYKYGLYAVTSTGSERLCLLALEDMEKRKPILDAEWDLVIVDETHRLLSNKTWYSLVQGISRRVENLLLLSATPIQDRNEEYHRLLALLNPEQYESMPMEQFAGYVKKQKRIQKTINQQYKRLNQFEDYGEIIVDKLKEMGDTLEDAMLHRMIASIDTNADDGGKELTSQAIAYICENYRLERKVIRNRRQNIAEKMAERIVDSIPYTPLTSDEAYNEVGAIQSALAYLSEQSGDEKYVTDIAMPLLGALFSSPWALTGQLKTLGIDDVGLQDSASIWLEQAEQEHRLVNEALDEDPDMIHGRLMWALNYLDQETDITTDSECKVVVFTGYNETLLAFEKLFASRYASQGIRAVSFGRHMKRDDLDDSVYAFQNESDCRVIICDETGGEGRNFQNATLVLHLDIPWNANALEQRIGRLDRLGRDASNPVLSAVLYAESSVEEQLFRIWKEGMKIFTQSLSGLEIVTGELNELIVEALEDDYYNGLTNAYDDILDQAEEMRESVEDEQTFDIGATLYRPLAQGINHVLDSYHIEDDNLFAQAMMGWGRQAGLEAEYPIVNRLVEFRESKFSPRAALQSVFMPPDWLVYADSSMMRRQRRILGSFDRAIAATREDVLFFAPGDALYDSIIQNAIGCSRGRCAAIGLSGPFQFDGFIFTYNVQCNLNRLLEKGVSPALLSQFKMYLPLGQIVIPIGLTDDAREVRDDDVMTLLRRAKVGKATHFGRRGQTKFNMSALESFMHQLPVDTWEPLVENCGKLADKKARVKLRDGSDIPAARDEMRRIVNGYRAECLFFEKDITMAENRRDEYQLVLQALKEAKPVLDSVCFLRVR